MRMRSAWVAMSLLLAALPATAGARSVGEAVPVVAPAFRGTLPDRFGLDIDGDGLIDLPNTEAYIRNGAGPEDPVRFRLQLDASSSRATLADSGLPIVEYRWRIANSETAPLTRSSRSPRIEVWLPEGSYMVTLDVEADLGWGTVAGRVEQQVTVADILIVAVGDSYASGDGNPERPRRPGGEEARWAVSPLDATATAAHAVAHRSTVAWPALAALALERADPTTSVTFVSLASTGASIRRGLLSAAGEETGQLEAAAALVGDRVVDVLLVSIGGNDIGFASIVRGLVDADPLGDPICYRVDLENIWAAAEDGDWNRSSALRFALPWGVGCRPTRETGRPVLPGLQGLAGELDALAAGIGVTLRASTVYVMEYPDPTGADATGAACSEIAGDLTPPFGLHEIDANEQAAARARVIDPLNRRLAEAAARHGWVYVGGPGAEFRAGHGYCATVPSYAPEGADSPPAVAPFGGSFTDRWYRHPADIDRLAAPTQPGVSWYRTAAQSAILQGPATRWDTTGTLHPNELGHLAIAAALVAAMEVPPE